MLEFRLVQVAFMLSFALVVCVGYGRLLQWSRNREFEHYKEVTLIDTPTTYMDGVWYAVCLLSNPAMGNWPDRPITLVHRIVCMGLAVVGILFLAVVTAIVVDSVTGKLKALKAGLGPVVERGHTVILGWDDKCYSLLRELFVAQREEGGGVIVILCKHDKAMIEKELQKRFSRRERARSEVVIRTGSWLHEAGLMLVSVRTARGVVLVSNKQLSPEMADAEVLQAVISLQSVTSENADALDPHSRPPNMVAELRCADSETQVSIVGASPSFAMLVSTAIIGRLMLIFVRKPGLARVYDSLLGFGGTHFFVASCEQLTGVRWRDVPLHFPRAIPFGIRTGHRVTLNPPAETIFRRRDELIMLAGTRVEDTKWIHGHPLSPLRRLNPTPPRTPMPEKVLFAGWRRDVCSLIAFLDRLVHPNSTLHILCPLSVAERVAVFAEHEFREQDLTHLTIVHHVGNPVVMRHVLAFHEKHNLGDLTSIVVLNNDVAVESEMTADSRTLATVMLLQGLRGGKTSTHGATCNAIVEILDERSLVVVSEAPGLWKSSDFLKSNELIAKMLAMVVREVDVKQILHEMFSGRGAELTVLASCELIAPDVEACFWELTRECVLRHRSTLCGYLQQPAIQFDEDGSALPPLPPECILNPAGKEQLRTWGPDISFICLRSPQQED